MLRTLFVMGLAAVLVESTTGTLLVNCASSCPAVNRTAGLIVRRNRVGAVDNVTTLRQRLKAPASHASEVGFLPGLTTLRVQTLLHVMPRKVAVLATGHLLRELAFVSGIDVHPTLLQLIAGASGLAGTPVSLLIDRSTRSTMLGLPFGLAVGLRFSPHLATRVVVLMHVEMLSLASLVVSGVQRTLAAVLGLAFGRRDLAQHGAMILSVRMHVLDTALLVKTMHRIGVRGHHTPVSEMMLRMDRVVTVTRERPSTVFETFHGDSLLKVAIPATLVGREEAILTAHELYGHLHAARWVGIEEHETRVNWWDESLTVG